MFLPLGLPDIFLGLDGLYITVQDASEVIFPSLWIILELRDVDVLLMMLTLITWLSVCQTSPL